MGNLERVGSQWELASTGWNWFYLNGTGQRLLELVSRAEALLERVLI